MIKPEYVQPVKQYAAATYSYDQIDNALAKGWITAQEHADTTALMPPRPTPPEPNPAPEQSMPGDPEPPVVIPPAATEPQADDSGGEEAV